MSTLKSIQEFLIPKRMAIAGVSRNKNKFGYQLFNDLKQKGFDIYPINPQAEKIDDTPCYKNVSDLPAEVSHLLIATPKEHTEAIVSEAISKGINNIWIQQMSETKEAIELAERNNIQIITHYCIYMFADPVKGFHKFHKTLNKLFGKYPK